MIYFKIYKWAKETKKLTIKTYSYGFFTLWFKLFLYFTFYLLRNFFINSFNYLRVQTTAKTVALFSISASNSSFYQQKTFSAKFKKNILRRLSQSFSDFDTKISNMWITNFYIKKGFGVTFIQVNWNKQKFKNKIKTDLVFILFIV